MLNRLKMQNSMISNRKTVHRFSVFAAAEIILVFLFFLSCSENPPEIEQLFWQSNRFNDLEKNTVYDTLSVFVQVDDQDGIEDIASLYIINDKQQLFWKIDSENLVIKENRNVTWVGSSRIKMNDYSMFPSGEYRVLVIDEAGEREETSFTLKNSSYMPEKEDFPALSVKGQNVTTDSNTDVLWIYNAEGDVITEHYPERKRQSFPLIENSDNLFVYRFDKTNGTGLVSGPYKVE